HPPYRHAKQWKKGNTAEVGGEPAPPDIREVLNPLIGAGAPKVLRFRPAESPVRERKSDETHRRRDHRDSSGNVHWGKHVPSHTGRATKLCLQMTILDLDPQYPQISNAAHISRQTHINRRTAVKFKQPACVVAKMENVVRVAAVAMVLSLGLLV